MNIDNNYINLLRDVANYGVVQDNRTGTATRFISSASLVSDLRFGFPILSTKPVPVKACFGEMQGFLRGYSSAEQFRALGCNIWNQNANDNEQWLASPFREGVDDLGKIYGNTWRSRMAYVEAATVEQVSHYMAKGYEHVGFIGSVKIMRKRVDMLHDVVDAIINKPTDRRIIMHAWFPELFDQMALPPCHVMYVFTPDVSNNLLHLTMYQRSCDIVLGVPFNHAGSAWLLSAVAKATGYTAGVLTHFMTNVHMYENHAEAAEVHIERCGKGASMPTLNIDYDGDTQSVTEALNMLENVVCSLDDYKPLGKLPAAPMAV